jgi:hypothetical protein
LGKRGQMDCKRTASGCSPFWTRRRAMTIDRSKQFVIGMDVGKRNSKWQSSTCAGSLGYPFEKSGLFPKRGGTQKV